MARAKHHVHGDGREAGLDQLPKRCYLYHEIRMSQRRWFQKQKPATRSDLGMLATTPHHLDAYDNTWLPRTKKQRFRLGKKSRSYLVSFLCGGTHTRQRLSRAKLSEDPSQICRFRSEAEETQEHMIRYCRAWRAHREPLCDAIPDEE